MIKKKNSFTLHQGNKNCYSPEEEKKIIHELKEKINKSLNTDPLASKKAAQIISLWLNQKKY
jgi:hypothetical protein